MTLPGSNLQERRLSHADGARERAANLLEEKSLQLFRSETQNREVAESALRESEERYRRLIESSPFSILIEVDQCVVFVNSAAKLLFGAAKHEDLLGSAVTSWLVKAWPSPDVAGEELHAWEDQARRLDGSLRDVSVKRIPVIYHGKAAVQAILSDISDRKQLEKQLFHQAKYDGLTGLANRQLMRQSLVDALAYAERYAQSVWVVFIDLDKFKFFNDSLGHDVGDLLLQEVAKRLLATSRDIDTVSRPSGDEFIMILPVRTHKIQPLNAVRRTMAALACPMTLKGKEISLTCSAGIAIYPSDGDTPEILLKHADMAMYSAKKGERGSFQFFTPALQEKALERMQIEDGLRSALERKEFSLRYQPQVDATCQKVVGVEATIRWQHSVLGAVRRNRFIWIAEEAGLLVSIGAWVIQSACSQAQAWQKLGFAGLRTAVNVSARQFSQPDFVQSVACALKQSELDPHFLELELTEGVLMADVEMGIKTLHELKALGISLAIDDYGTGHSSLANLKSFPIDVLKIDKTFVRELVSDSDSTAIVLSIISLAHNLKMRVMANGVETNEQCVFLQSHGCDEIQGHFISKPLASVQLEQFLIAPVEFHPELTP